VSKTNAPFRVPPAVTNAPPAVIAATPAKTNTPPPAESVEPAPPVQVVDLDKEPDFIATDVKDAPAASTNQQLALNNASTAEEPPLIAPRRREDEEKRGIISRLKQGPTHWFDRDEPRPAPVPIPPQRTAANSETTAAAPRVAPAVRPPPIARYDYRKNLNIARGNRAAAEKLFNQGAAAHRQRRLPEAIGLYRQALALDPSYFEASYNLGLAAYQSNDLPLALSANEQAVAIKPASVDARYNFALTLRASRYFIDAAHELRELLNLAPGDARAHLALANLYLQNLDEPALARTHYQHFLELAPNHADADAVRQLLIMRR
jgi:tetratricopeptide (TPR) repeat protein